MAINTEPKNCLNCNCPKHCNNTNPEYPANSNCKDCKCEDCAKK
jgi:hypothetical protein